MFSPASLTDWDVSSFVGFFIFTQINFYPLLERKNKKKKIKDGKYDSHFNSFESEFFLCVKKRNRKHKHK